MGTVFTKNIPIDEKRISRIENVITRLMRRTVKKTSAIIPPFPISAYANGSAISGDILKHMFSARGVVDKFMVRTNKLKSGSVINIMIENDLGSNSKSYVMPRRDFTANLSVHVFSGDRLTVSIAPADNEEFITEVWVSVLWTTHVKDSLVKSYLIDELDSAADKLLEDASNAVHKSKE